MDAATYTHRRFCRALGFAPAESVLRTLLETHSVRLTDDDLKTWVKAQSLTRLGVAYRDAEAYTVAVAEAGPNAGRHKLRHPVTLAWT